MTKLWTPNQALAHLRGCKEEDCLWVWQNKKLAQTPMSKDSAFYAAKQIDRDL